MGDSKYWRDFIHIHEWFDSTKSAFPNMRHRAILHNSFGIYLCQQVFGEVIVTSTGKEVPTRLVAEQHVMDDLRRIPTIQDWLEKLPTESWMGNPERLSREFEGETLSVVEEKEYTTT